MNHLNEKAGNHPPSWFAISLGTPPWRFWRSITPMSPAVCGGRQRLSGVKIGGLRADVAAIATGGFELLTSPGT